MSDAINSDNTVDPSEIKRNKPGRPPKSDAILKVVSPEDAPPPPAIPDKQKLSPAQVQAQLVQYLARTPITITTPSPVRGLVQYPQNIRVFRSRAEDAPLLAEVTGNTAFFTLPLNIASDLATHCGTFAGFDSCFNITLATAQKVVEWFMYMKRPFADPPASWGFKSSKELCFNRLPYDPKPVEDDFELGTHAPTFAEMLSRTKNATAFVARLGSIFFKDASRKQACLLYGESGGGKSQLQNILNALLGSAVAQFRDDDFKDAFISAELRAARVAYIEECDPEFFRTKYFKILTGTRKIRIRQIFTQGCPGEIDTILFMSSNRKPEIPNDKALMSRIIPCEVEIIDDARKLPELEVLRRLKDEAPSIAGYCMRIYQEQCPNHEEITFDHTVHLQPHVDSYESEHLEKLEGWFENGPELFMTTKMFNAACRSAELYTAEDKKKFLEVISRRFPYVKKDRGYIEGVQYRGICGLIDKTSPK